MIAEVRRNGATVTLIAEGHIDGSNASVFQNALSSAIEKTDLTVIVDFDRVSYISSAGLRTLLMASKDLQRRGARLCLCSMQYPVREVFAISGFDKIMAIYESELVALEQFGT